MRDLDKSLSFRARNDKIAVRIGDAIVQRIEIGRQESNIGETDGIAPGIKNLTNKPDGISLRTFHEDVGIQLNDTHGMIATDLFHGLQDGCIPYIGRDHEILQFLVYEIDGNGVTIIVEREQGI